jgi:hypothetical protein
MSIWTGGLVEFASKLVFLLSGAAALIRMGGVESPLAEYDRAREAAVVIAGGIHKSPGTYEPRIPWD